MNKAEPFSCKWHGCGLPSYRRTRQTRIVMAFRGTRSANTAEEVARGSANPPGSVLAANSENSKANSRNQRARSSSTFTATTPSSSFGFKMTLRLALRIGDDPRTHKTVISSRRGGSDSGVLEFNPRGARRRHHHLRRDRLHCVPSAKPGIERARSAAQRCRGGNAA
jgi:hypothetical protein